MSESSSGMARRDFLKHSALFTAAGPAFRVTPASENKNFLLSLDGAWNYLPLARTLLKPDESIVEDKSNLPGPGKMPVPSNWHVHGLPNFSGRVRFERDFENPRELASSERAFLLFRGIDYFSEIQLNGALVGRHEGYFQRFEFDVTPNSRRGLNHLAVTVDAPREEPGTVWPEHKRLIKGIFTHWDGKPGGLMKEFGQDGTTAGIWNSVEFLIRRTAWIGNVKISPVLEKTQPASSGGNGSFDAKLFITLQLHTIMPGRYSVTAQAGGSQVSSQWSLAAGESTVTLVLPIRRPRLWWTWDLGESFVYSCDLLLDANGELVDQRAVHFGVRSIELDEKTGEWRLNGERFFIRGTNIVPEMWLSRYTPDRIDHDIKLLRQAYINGVRVCVHVNRNEFYDALDRAGIVAWQDFPLQWTYATDDSLLQEASRQLRDMIRQLYNHPSIITWVCQNESSGENLTIMDPFLARVGEEEDSSRPVRPVSSYNEHAYPGWILWDYHDYLTLPGAPMVTEFGAQAFPSLEETHALFGDEWPPDWSKLAYHGFRYQDAFLVAKLPIGNSWTVLVENSQRYQAKLLKFALEAYRRAKYQKIGSLFQFQFVDPWPAVTFTVLSYERQPKLGYLALQSAYQPILIGAKLDRAVWSKGRNLVPQVFPEIPLTSSGAPQVRISPWIVNDAHRAIESAAFEVRLRAQDVDVLIATRKLDMTIAADSVLDLDSFDCAPPPALSPGSYDFVLLLKQGTNVLSENSYAITVVE